MLGLAGRLRAAERHSNEGDEKERGIVRRDGIHMERVPLLRMTKFPGAFHERLWEPKKIYQCVFRTPY
jgi:hypothetical protein